MIGTVKSPHFSIQTAKFLRLTATKRNPLLTLKKSSMPNSRSTSFIEITVPKEVKKEKILKISYFFS